MPRPSEQRSLYPPPPAILALEAPLREALENSAPILSYKQGESVFKQNAPATTVYCIRAGTIKLVRERPQGPRIVHLALPGEMLGMSAVLIERPHSFSAVAQGPVEAQSLEAGLFMAALRASRAFCEAVLLQVAQDLTAAREELALQGDLPMPVRLARLLLDLHLRLPGGGVAPSLRLTRYDLADILGSAQETISRSLGTLEAAGVIVREGRSIRVRDADALLSLTKNDRSNIHGTLEALRKRAVE